MKKWIVLPLAILSTQLWAQTLFTYGKHQVTAQEFINAFDKNKVASDTDKTALENYLDLYINFKLKVQSGKDAGLDTMPSLKADAQTFKHQIEKNFLYDKSVLQSLVDEAVARSKTDVRLTAYTITPLPETEARDLLKIANEIRQLLRQNKSVDTTALRKKGAAVSADDVGFVTAFTLPYRFENEVYKLKKGAYSEPLSVGEAYIIFKKEDERHAAGKIKIAQILIPVAREFGATEERAKKLADSLYNELLRGAVFAELAKQFSTDRTTYFNGGEMPAFGVGKYAPDFEIPAFALRADGDISKPFRTDFGYHILKRISAEPVPQVADADFAYEVRQRVLEDERVSIATTKLVAGVKNKIGFQSVPVRADDLKKVVDSFMIKGDRISSGGVDENTALFRFNDKSTATVRDWQMFLRNSGRVNLTKLQESYDELWPEFEQYSILKNYQDRLEEFDADFARQMKEFEEGNMLFELMQRNVWTPAANDSQALREYYVQHKDRYKWGKSADAIVFFCANKDLATQCIDELKSGAPWREVMERNSLMVQADSGRYEVEQLPFNGAQITAGFTNLKVDSFDGSASFARVLKIYPEGMQREFEHARGLVIEDYQKVLEDNWLERLKQKYPVKINDKTWSAVRKNYAATPR